MKNLVSKIKVLENQIIKEEKEKIYKKQERYFLTEMKKIGIERLPYSYSALKRFVDPETMDTHYNKHYKGYVDKLNGALSQGKFGDLELEQIVKSIKKYNKTIKNNAGGAFNHALFWKMLSPKEIKPEKFEIFKKISSEFNNFRNFIKQFESAAKDRFGSGWVWLVLTKAGRLKIMSTANQENPLMNTVEDGGYPLLGLDLWEHAYYLKYKNKKDDYIKNFWKVVNWEFVDKLYQMKKETKINEQFIMSRILSEGRKYSDTEKMTQQIFSRYDDIVREYSENIREYMKELYPEYWVDHPNKYIAGIYNYDSEGRSIINKIDTHYIVLAEIIDRLNEFFKKSGIDEKIEMDVNDKDNVKKGMDKTTNYIGEYKERILGKNSKLFPKLYKIIQGTHEKGEKNENDTVEILKKHFGQENVEKTGGMESQKDRKEGIDVEIKYKGKLLIAQVKPATEIIESNGNYEIVTKSRVKRYYTNWMIFIKDSKKVYVFDTKNVKIVNGQYIVPTEHLLFKLE